MVSFMDVSLFFSAVGMRQGRILGSGGVGSCSCGRRK